MLDKLINILKIPLKWRIQFQETFLSKYCPVFCQYTHSFLFIYTLDILRPIHTAQTNAKKLVVSSWLLDLESYEK